MFPRTFAAFQALRNQPPRIRSYFAQVDLAFAKGDLELALDLLSRRPGDEPAEQELVSAGLCD